MRMFLAIGILALSLAPLRAEDTGDRTTTPIADALDWYSLWFGSGPGSPGSPATQTCRGELRGSSYSFRCDPLSVVVAAVRNEAGHCSITSMRPSVGAEDGVRVQTLDHLVPPGVPRRKGAAPEKCGELPVKEGRFDITVTPHPRPVNSTLTRAAREAAIAYSKKSGDRGCLLRFPNVKTGDPFFHVYEECQGTLDQIWEFTIEDGRVADYAHWFYNRKRGFPKGVEWRRDRPDLWFEVSRPEERSPASRK